MKNLQKSKKMQLDMYVACVPFEIGEIAGFSVAEVTNVRSICFCAAPRSRWPKHSVVANQQDLFVFCRKVRLALPGKNTNYVTN